MAAWADTDVKAFLAASDITVNINRVERLKGGYWNEVFRVCGRDIDWVVKRYVRVLEDSLFPNLPAEESRALKALSGLGVAPEHIFFSDTSAGAVLVYSYATGCLWQDDTAMVASLLHRKRQADPSGFRQVPGSVNAINVQGDGLFARCREDDLVIRYQQQRRTGDVAVPVAAPVLIHTDIGAGNLVEGAGGVTLIDWQCPACGDDAEDAYSFLSPGFQILNQRPPLSPQQRELFFHTLADPALEERLHILEPAYAYRMGGYMCLRAQMLARDDEQAAERYRCAALAELERLETLP